jgi:WD40 repeat protein
LVYTNQELFTASNARVVLSYLDFSQTGDKRQENRDIRFIASPENRYAAFQNQLCVISADGLRIFPKAAREEAFFPMSSESPILLSGQRFLLAYDFGKNYVNIFNNGGLVQNLVFDYPVYSASISDSGYFAVSSGARGYKGCVVVFDRNMRKIFEWFSSEGYIPDVDISPANDALCAASLLTDGGKITSSLSLYRIDSSTPLKVIPMEEDLVVDVAYKDPNLIAAVSDQKILLLDGKGEEKGTYTYPEGHLWAYSLEPKRYNVFAVAQNMLGEDISVYIVDNSGAEVARFSVAGGVKDLKANDDGIAILTSGKLLHLDFTGRLTDEKDVFADAKEIVLCDQGGYLVSVGMAEYIQLR